MESIKDVREVQSLLGLISYYRCFLPKIAATTRPLTALTLKDGPLRLDQHTIHGCPTTIYTDHRPLVNFLTQKYLPGQQARYLIELMEFSPDLEIKSISGKENCAADAPCRSQTVSCNAIIQLEADKDISLDLTWAYQQDPFTRKFLPF